MQTKIVVGELKKIIQENRKKHRAIFEEAVEGYRKQAIDRLEEHIDSIKKGKLVKVSIYLPCPEDHTRDYDRILKMINHHSDKEITLSEQDYQAYVMDDWAWKQAFITSNSVYSMTAASMLQVDEGAE